MRLPSATRRDYNPPAIVFPLGFLRWTSYSCPHCKHVFRRDFWPYNVGLGSGGRLCRHCGKVFVDGAREWPDLTLPKKLRFFFPLFYLECVEVLNSPGFYNFSL